MLNAETGTVGAIGVDDRVVDADRSASGHKATAAVCVRVVFDVACHESRMV